MGFESGYDTLSKDTHEWSSEVLRTRYVLDFDPWSETSTSSVSSAETTDKDNFEEQHEAVWDPEEEEDVEVEWGQRTIREHTELVQPADGEATWLGTGRVWGDQGYLWPYRSLGPWEDFYGEVNPPEKLPDGDFDLEYEVGEDPFVGEQDPPVNNPVTQTSAVTAHAAGEEEEQQPTAESGSQTNGIILIPLVQIRPERLKPIQGINDIDTLLLRAEHGEQLSGAEIVSLRTLVALDNESVRELRQQLRDPWFRMAPLGLLPEGRPSGKGGGIGLDEIQAGLSIWGWVPVIGEFADGTNAIISAGRGNFFDAAANGISMFPLIGDAIGKGGKLARETASHVDEGIEGGTTAMRGAAPQLADAPSSNTFVIGRQVDTAVAKEWPGHKILDIPDWSLAKNDEWIQSIIKSKSKVYTGSPATRPNVWDALKNRETVFGRELRQLQEAGYKWDGDYLVPPL